MDDNIKIQIPMPKLLRERSLKKAEEMGFSSLQELIRFLLTQFSVGNIKPTVVNYEEETISVKAQKRLLGYLRNAEKEYKKGNLKKLDFSKDIISQMSEKD